MEMLNQFMSGNFNVAVPLPYVLTALGVLLGAYFAVRKVIAVVFGLFAFMAKTNFAIFASAVMLISGLMGGGWSIGELNSGVSTPGIMTNADLRSLVFQADNKDKPVAISNVMEYAKWRDNLLLSNNYSQSKQVEVSPAVTDYRIPGSLLGGSLGLVICSIVIFVIKMY